MAPHFVDIGGKRYLQDRVPDECPVCHYAVEPTEESDGLCPLAGRPNQILEVVFRCVRRDCRRHFIARYIRSGRDVETTASKLGIGSPAGEFRLSECVPVTPPPVSVPTEVANISPEFSEIYSQAFAAEAYGLDQVAGCAFRKAIEFLVKDFCIHSHPDEEEKIRSAFLANCIENFINSPEAKICAKRAAWLGNDEVHYERRWEGKDLQNLKELIQLTLNWIHSILMTEKYMDEMPGG